MNISVIKSDVISTLRNALGIKVPDFENRIAVIAETEKYRWKEDESIWNQQRGKSAYVFEVYFDGEFVCFFDLAQTMDEVVIEFLTGFKSLISTEKIFVNQEMYKVKSAAEEAKRKAESEIVIDAPTTPEERILTEVLTRQAKKRKKKVVVKKKAASL